MVIHTNPHIRVKKNSNSDLAPALAMPINSHSWVEISKNKVTQNVHIIKQAIGEAQLGVIIKGNAYGHGIAPVAKILQNISEVGWAIAFCLSEAITARLAGFEKQLLVCGYADGSIEAAIQHDIDLVLHDEASLQRYLQVAKKVGKTVKVHLKVDTGLARLGFAPDEVVTVLASLQHSKQIMVKGIFTHFAESDADDNWYAKQQLKSFDELLSRLAQLQIKIPIIHLANTVAIFRLPQTCKSLVRVGGGVYGLRKKIKAGLMPAIYEELQPVITWKSKIIQIREIPANSFVSYGRTFKTASVMRIAAVPVGYADGYGRELSNNSVMYVNGELAPVVGRVCMNLTMIDITKTKNIAVGDEVVLLGDHDGIRVSDFMQRLNTIACDVTTRINWTISRVIV